MKPSTILSGASTVLSKLSGLGGNWGIAAGFGSALLGVGAGLLDDSSPATLPHVERVRAAGPAVARALARAETEKARLLAGGAPRP